MRLLVQIAFLALVVVRAAFAEDAASSMPGVPGWPAGDVAPSDAATVDVDAIPAPMVLRQEDADQLLRTPAVTPPPAPPAPDGPVSRTIPIDGSGEAKPVVNPSTHFLFFDVTERPTPAQRTLAERQTAVEAVRQTLRRTGTGR